LQEWGKNAWSVAPSSPITADHVRIATVHALVERSSRSGQRAAKGMVYSPDHGDTAFAVPLFDQLMMRMMPAGRR